MEEFLLHMGVNPADVFAAFAGGVCAAFVSTGEKPTVIGILSSVIVGTGVGAFGGPVLPPYVGFKPSAFATFMCGAAGLPIITGFRAAATRIRWSTPDAKTN